MPGIDKLVQLRIEQGNIGRVQAGGGLIQHVDRVPAPRVAGALQFRGELDALRLATGKLRCALP